MQIPLQITVRDIPASEAVETRIRSKAAKLEQFYGHITSCRVVVEMPHKHHHQGKHFNVRIDITVPGNEIVINRDHHEDVYVALRDGFEAARRQLDEYVQRVRRNTKKHAPEHMGRVLRLSREEGIGFLAGPDGTEHYFSSENVVSPTFAQLQEGDEVKFIEEVAGEGVQAKRISIGRHRGPQ